jgi:hypothetical protein
MVRIIYDSIPRIAVFQQRLGKWQPDRPTWGWRRLAGSARIIGPVEVDVAGSDRVLWKSSSFRDAVDAQRDETKADPGQCVTAIGKPELQLARQTSDDEDQPEHDTDVAAHIQPSLILKPMIPEPAGR